ncbi:MULTISPECIES: phage holin family protein [Streptomyces]|uniref:Phage holin family protein n=1 Tax=Streptomyces maoxianensis TaxID=1459942 RepID=A0ABV9GAL3_9ACTN|nr:phage holin family protein [Streptomyces sp. ISL-1]MBT2392057.1 phage holin family protein [Streptomyces sp. ISL-1]
MQALSQDVIALISEDVDQVKAELVAAVTEGRRGSAALGAGGALGLLALLAAQESAVRALERVWPAQRVVGALAAAYGVGAVAFAAYGRARLRQARAASREAVTCSLDAVGQVADELSSD